MATIKKIAEIDGIKAGSIVKVATGRTYKLLGEWFKYTGVEMEWTISANPLKKDGTVRNANRPNFRNITMAEIVKWHPPGSLRAPLFFPRRSRDDGQVSYPVRLQDDLWQACTGNTSR